MVSTDLVSRLTRAASHLERGAGIYEQAGKVEVPDWLFRGRAIKRMYAGFTMATAEARRGLAELEAIGAPVRDAREAIATKVGYLDPANGLRLPGAWDHLNMRQMPDEIRHQARALRLQAELEASGTDPAQVRGALRAEVQELVSRPLDQLTKRDLDRIATIDMLPAHLRPELPPTINPHTPLGRLSLYEFPLTYSTRHVRAELDNVRLDGVARSLADDPAVTRESLDAELRAILALPDEQVTAALGERVAIIERAPAHLRPTLLEARLPRGFIDLRNMSAWEYLPSNEGAARDTYDALRRAVLHEQLAADPAFTREVATDELLRLLAKPDQALTRAELVRISTIAGLPEHVRPSLPVATDEWSSFGRADNKVLRPTHAKAIDTFARTRAQLAEQRPERMAELLAEQHRAGNRIDLEVVAALAKHPGLLDRVGIDAAALHRQTIFTLEAVNGTKLLDLPSSLRVARNVIEAHPATDPAVRGLRDEALELADRNLARMAGERADTYGRHPDYAEVGRFASIANLLHELRSSAEAAAADAAPAGESLAW
jgi:hypothetical protein